MLDATARSRIACCTWRGRGGLTQLPPSRPWPTPPLVNLPPPPPTAPTPSPHPRYFSFRDKAVLEMMTRKGSDRRGGGGGGGGGDKIQTELDNIHRVCAFCMNQVDCRRKVSVRPKFRCGSGLALV